MDDSAFDELTRSLALPSRRGLLGTALGSFVAALRFDATEAKKKGKGKGKGKKKKKKKKGGGGQAPPPDENDSVGIPRRTCVAGGPVCDGCCQGAQCLPGNTDTACEKQGFACENCAEQGEVCNEFQSCQCEAQACKALGGCCVDRLCIVGEPDRCCTPEGETGCDPLDTTDCCEGLTCVENHIGAGYCVKDCRIHGCPNPAPYRMKCCQATGECHYDKCEDPLCPGTNMVNCRRTCNIPGQPPGSGQNPPHLDLCPEGTTICCTNEDGCVTCVGGPHNGQTCGSGTPKPPVVCPD